MLPRGRIVPLSRIGTGTLFFGKGSRLFAASAVTGVLLWLAGLFDADLNVVGTQAAAKWLTQWEGGWGRSAVVGLLSIVPALPAIFLFDSLFNVSPLIRHWRRPTPMPKERRPADRSTPLTLSQREGSGMSIFAKAVIIFGLLGALFVGFISFVGILGNESRNLRRA
jgi:hypothetical protein